MDRSFCIGCRLLRQLFTLAAVAVSFPLLMPVALAESPLPSPFVTVWDTGDSDTSIFFRSKGEYEIEWRSLSDPSLSGRVSASSIRADGEGPAEQHVQTLEFPEPGRYRVSFHYGLEHFMLSRYVLIGDSFDSEDSDYPDRESDFLVRVEQWGEIEWTSMATMFNRGRKLKIDAPDRPDLSRVTSMAYMFADVEDPQADLSGWQTQNVTNMAGLFYRVGASELGIAGWDVSNVRLMSEMFYRSGIANEDLSEWDVGQVEDMRSMFEGSAFKGDIGAWDVSSVRSMRNMFRGTQFNADIRNWNVSAVTDLYGMFMGSTFNRPLNSWDVSSAENLAFMFFANDRFNQPLDNWNVSSVVDFTGFLLEAWRFNQDISAWSFDRILWADDMLSGSAISVAHYDALLLALADQTLPNGVEFGAQGLRYCAAETARSELINLRGWEITGDLLDCETEGTPTAAVHFGVVKQGEQASAVYRFQNTTDAAVSIAAVALDGADELFSLIGGSCGETVLEPDALCTVELAGDTADVGLSEDELQLINAEGATIHAVTVTLAVVAAKPNLDAEWTLGERELTDNEVVELGLIFDVLSVFYFRMGGEDWTRQNGWLNPELHPCDWYGVGCGSLINSFAAPPPWQTDIKLATMSLPDNNLTGELTSFVRLNQMAGVDLERPNGPISPTILELSHNPLSAIERLPVLPQAVLLEQIGLGGALPPAESTDLFPSGLRHLSLAGNGFSGELPDSWIGLGLSGLDLSDNAFTASAEQLSQALQLTDFQDIQGINQASENYRCYLAMPWTEIYCGYRPFRLQDAIRRPKLGLMPGLHLAGNRIAQLGDSSAQVPFFGSLCWNELSLSSEQALRSAFEGTSEQLSQCQSVDRQSISPAMSGSWYAPDRNGEGMNLLLLENGNALGIWYMHAEAGRQVWMLGQGRPVGKALDLSRMTNYAGVFGEGYEDGPQYLHRFPEPDKGFGLYLKLSQLDTNTLAASHAAQYDRLQLNERAFAAGQSILGGVDEGDHPYAGLGYSEPRAPYDSGTQRPLTRLTSIAGTTCDNRHEHQWVSGLWYEPASDGEGLMIEYTANEQAVVYWYTYAPDGSEQAWMLGVGTFDGQRLVVENMRQPQHTGDVVFDTAGIEQDVTWGSLEINFSDQSNGELRYTSVMDGYGSGTRELTKLASPMMASGCEASVH